MQTHPIWKEDGSLLGFEITSTWLTMRALLRLLRSVSGVTDVRRQWFNDDRVIFKFCGKNAVVNEPWGDNSRYRIGLEEPHASPGADIRPIHEAFRCYRGLPVMSLLPKSQNDC
jgi:hypothetical protein